MHIFSLDYVVASEARAQDAWEEINAIVCNR